MTNTPTCCVCGGPFQKNGEPLYCEFCPAVSTGAVADLPELRAARGDALLEAHLRSLDPDAPTARERLVEALGEPLTAELLRSCSIPAMSEMPGNAPAAPAAPDLSRAREILDAATVAIAAGPPDCTDACQNGGECNCSGDFSPIAYQVDLEALRAALGL